ncbi:ATP synthase subunit I [Gammaproteobacteria bacterium]|nr:ATP synthase subunit I [Gammaproteobacteria bacterium]
MSRLIKIVKSELVKISTYQFMMIFLVSPIVVIIGGYKNAWSFLGGALSYWLPTLVYLMRVSNYAGARALNSFMLAFVVGEFLKIILCATLFLIAINLLNLKLIYALIGLFLAIVIFWAASFMVLFKTRVGL